MADPANYGIVGDVTAQNVAVGTNARVDVGDHATIDVAALDPRIAAQLAQLGAAIARFDGDAEARSALAHARAEVADALAQPRPDKAGLLASLSAVADVAGSTSAIAGAATALAGLVGMIL